MLCVEASECLLRKAVHRGASLRTALQPPLCSYRITKAQAEGQTPAQLSPGPGQVGDSLDTAPEGRDSSHIYRSALELMAANLGRSDHILHQAVEKHSILAHTTRHINQDQGWLPAPLIILAGLLSGLGANAFPKVEIHLWKGLDAAFWKCKIIS